MRRTEINKFISIVSLNLYKFTLVIWLLSNVSNLLSTFHCHVLAYLCFWSYFILDPALFCMILFTIQSPQSMVHGPLSCNYLWSCMIFIIVFYEDPEQAYSWLKAISCRRVTSLPSEENVTYRQAPSSQVIYRAKNWNKSYHRRKVCR